MFLAVVFAAKIVVARQLDQHPLLGPDAGLDTAAHLGLARRVLTGDLWLGPGLYYMSPLYTYFLAALLSIRDSLLFVRGVQAALGTAAVWCVMATAREWFGARAGWIAGAIAVLTGEFTFYEILIQQSALDTFLTAAALLCLAFALVTPVAQAFRPAGMGSGRPDRLRQGSGESAEALRAKAEGLRYGFLAGLLFGLQTLNRPNVLIAAAAIAMVLAASRRWRVAAALSAGVLCCLMVVVARNAIVSHEFALLSSQGGLNFYIGNNASATGQYVAVPGVRSNIEGQSEDTRRVASEALGHPVADSQASAYFTMQALDWVRSQPTAATRLILKKLLLVFNWRHQWLDYSYPYYAHDLDTCLRVLAIGPWLIVPIGLAGLVVLGRGKAPRTFRLWTAFIPAYALSVAVFFVAERYRLPLLVGLCVPAGGLIDRFPDIRRQRGFGVTAVGCLAAGCAIAYWPFHMEDGRFEERLRLSKVLMNRGDFDGAVRELEAAHTLRPDDLVAEFTLGTALVSSGRAAEGIEHMRHAVNRGVPVPGARYALAGAILATGDKMRAAAAIRTLTPEPADDADSCYHVALLALDAGESDVAGRFLVRALQLRPGWPEAEQLLAKLHHQG